MLSNEHLYAKTECPQVFHAVETCKAYYLNMESTLCVETLFKKAMAFESDAEVFRYASDQVSLKGLFVELGTHSGRTANFLAALHPFQTIHTFDSYLGLPEDWDKGDRFIKGALFAWDKDNPRPTFLNNVQLHEGWFSDTLPPFIASHEGPLAFLHVDCDIYSSTAEAFKLLKDRIVEGTIILFDEFYNYPNYKNHEFKALQQFLKEHSLRAEYLAYNAYHEQAAVKIHKS